MLLWSRASAPGGTAIRVAVGRQGTGATRTVAIRFDQEVLINGTGGRDVGVPGGGPWTSRGKVGGTGYGDWCHVIAVDPFDDNVILSGGQQLYRTPDGGATWSLVINYYAPHEDQHRVAFDPSRQGVVYAANDGGVFRSTDGGVTWQVGADDVTNRIDLTHGLVTAQFYTAGLSGDHAMGNLYHQGIVAADSLRTGSWGGVSRATPGSSTTSTATPCGTAPTTCSAAVPPGLPGRRADGDQHVRPHRRRRDRHRPGTGRGN